MMVKSLRVIVIFLFSSLAIASPSSSAKIASFEFSTPLEPQTLSTKNNHIKLATILGKDTRQKLPDNLRKFKLNIGLLSSDSGNQCTAFCISKKLAITAAHCIFGSTKTKNTINPTFLTFRLDAGRVKRSTIPGRNTKETLAHIISGQRKPVRAGRDTKRDWAIFELSKPICLGNLELADPTTSDIARHASKNKLFMVGYHGDRSILDGLLISTECKLRNRNNSKFMTGAQRRHYSPAKNFLLHTCDTYKGSSGSPVFIETKNGPKIIALNTGGFFYQRYRKRGNKIKWWGKKRNTNIALRTNIFLDIANKLKSETLITSKEEIQLLQKTLQEAGYAPGPTDGVFGPATKKAIKMLERKNKIPLTGLPTKQLLFRLQQHLALQ